MTNPINNTLNLLSNLEHSVSDIVILIEDLEYVGANKDFIEELKLDLEAHKRVYRYYSGKELNLNLNPTQHTHTTK